MACNSKEKRESDSNWHEFHRFAIEWLKKSQWAPIQTDKDGGWCLTPRNMIVGLYREKLDPAKYESVAWAKVQEAIDAFDKVGNAVAKAYEDQALANWIRVAIAEAKPSAVIQKMMANIKTHKEKPSLRLIHSATGHPATCLQILIRKVLMQYVGEKRHIFQNTDDVQKAILEKVPKGQKNFRIVTLDLSDFYMSGEHKMMVETTFDHIEDGEKE